MNITITIPDGKLAEFRVGFLRENPVPVDEETGQPTMTELQWLKAWIVGKLKTEYAAGKRKIAIESSPAVIVDPEIS